MTGATVAAGDGQTAEAGAAILRAGGNAIDAVCAAAFASWVVEPPLGSAAGGGLLLHASSSGVELFDFFTRVPGLGLPPVDRTAIDFHAMTVDFGPTKQDFHIGRGSAALPTAAYGFVEAHRRLGRLPLTEVVGPAVDLARNGWTVSPHMRIVLGMLAPILTLTPGVRAMHCITADDTQVAPANSRLRNPPLAAFLEALARGGRAFLDGPYADAVLQSFGPEHGGRLTRADLQSIQVTTRAPLRVPFAGYTVITPSPPASGGSLVALGLVLAERLGIPKMPWQGPEWCEAVARVQRAVSLARTSGFDDAVFEPGAADLLLAEPNLDRWMALAALEERALGGTTHVSVIDADGACASMTMSNGEGCGHVIGDFGVHMNNFLGEEDINPGGFHARPAGSPMTTMMTPTLALDGNGRPALVIGTGGANRIRSAVFMSVLNRLGHGRSIDEAANAPRMHVEGDRLWFEAEDLPAASVAALDNWPTLLGAHAKAASVARFDARSMFFGGINAVAIEDGQPVGAGDRRRGGRVAFASGS